MSISPLSVFPVQVLQVPRPSGPMKQAWKHPRPRAIPAGTWLVDRKTPLELRKLLKKQWEQRGPGLTSLASPCDDLRTPSTPHTVLISKLGKRLDDPKQPIVAAAALTLPSSNFMHTDACLDGLESYPFAIEEKGFHFPHPERRGKGCYIGTEFFRSLLQFLNQHTLKPGLTFTSTTDALAFYRRLIPQQYRKEREISGAESRTIRISWQNIEKLLETMSEREISQIFYQRKEALAGWLKQQPT